ncbi:MAG: ABC transporter substrate-binding protein [Deltaproteobacteria bacterium]|jgi:iron complex transport system substrate-binding protein|nr:ABC transporter substrate-binding protein [Deltaproteobacteria bacterium]
MMSRIIYFWLGLMIGLSLSLSDAFADYPMSFENKGRVITVRAAPKKALTFGTPAAEIMAALGLGPFMLGRIQGREGLLPEYEAALKEVPKYFDPDVESQEIVKGADFFFGQFPKDAREIRWDWLPVYVLEPGSLEDLYQRIREIGQIFQVEDRADRLLTELNDKLYQTTSRLTSYEPIKALVYDIRADGVYTAGGPDFESRLVDLAGGDNIFSDLEAWSKVTPEEILARDPEAIIVLDYGTEEAEKKVASLKAHPVLSQTRAVKLDKILIMTLNSLESGLRAPQAVETLAKFFHPSLYEVNASK